MKSTDQVCYVYDTPVELTADADDGWTFAGWSVDLVSSNNPDTIVMNENKTVTATFTEDCYVLDITIVGNGDVLKNPYQACYVYDTPVVLTADADDG